MKKIIVALSLLLIENISYGQVQSQQTGTNAKISDTELFTSKKPADASPAVFANKSEMDAKKADKIDKTKQKLIENSENPEMVKFLQEELWRFENAIAKELNK